jgi:hypothetical protein
MPLQRSLQLPTGVNLATAYGDVTDWNLQGAAHIAVITLTWWANKAAHDAGLPPVIPQEVVNLTVQEQQGGAANLIGVFYGIVLARADYAGTVVV